MTSTTFILKRELSKGDDLFKAIFYSLWFKVCIWKYIYFEI